MESGDSWCGICFVNLNLLTSDPNCELPKMVEGGGPAGVKDAPVGGGPAGVVDGFSAISLKTNPSLDRFGRESGVVGGLDENGTWKVDMAGKCKHDHQDVLTSTGRPIFIQIMIGPTS